METFTDTKNINEQKLENFFSKSGNLMESKTSKLDDILQEKLEMAFNKQTSRFSVHDLAKIALEHTPIDLAYAVSHLPPSARPILYDNLPNRESKIEFVINTDSDTRLTIFRYMGDKEMKKLFEKMPTNEAVSVLEDMSERRYKRVLELIEPKKAARIRELKKHNRNSAGRLMTSEFFAFSMDMTIGEAAEYIRDFPRIDFTRGIFVLNHLRELQGMVPGRNMIINPTNLPLRQVMRPVLHKVYPEATREEVVDIVERYKVFSLPVVDQNNHLIGVIIHEDVVEVMEDLADETIAKMAGTVEKVLPSDPLLKKFCSRSPWLAFTLVAGLFNGCVISFFRERGGMLIAFTLLFVPLITAMSGNVGIQCSTVLVRSMAIGVMSAGGKREAIYKELIIGLFTGTIFGIGCALVVYLINLITNSWQANPLILSMIVGSGLIGACFTGTLLGVFSPILFARIGIDPAVASGPIVTALNDVFSMTIYFLIALGLGSLFL